MNENHEIDETTFLDEEFIEDDPFSIARSLEPDEMDSSIHEERKKKREQKEIPSLIWLVKEIKLTRKEDMLIGALKLARSGNGYKIKEITKRDGGKREISVPAKTLKGVQRRINKYILTGFLVSKNVSGFSGGSVQEAIRPHLKAKSILCVDFKDAFPSVLRNTVFNYFTEGRTISVGYYPYCHYDRTVDYGYFSWYAAMIITDLTTHNGKLPQGAPTSPRIFDLVCREMDNRLSKLAANVGGNYTRYADNIFFSIGEEEFPRPLRQAILKVIEGTSRAGHNYKHKHWRPDPHFQWHKLRVRRINNGAVRLLGLNVIDGKIHNTRDFKRAVRLSIHHTNWLLNNGKIDTLEFETAWRKLQGQMNFARTDTLPPKLLNDYIELNKRLS